MKRKKTTGRRALSSSAQRAASHFHVSHAKPGGFKANGLRAFFEYRDLGIAKATGGKMLAHVIRARHGRGALPERHYHKLKFQMVYVLKGWVEFEYEGVGRVRLRKGSCVYQPPGIRHIECRHSSDLEMIEITSPAEFPTHTS